MAEGFDSIVIKTWKMLSKVRTDTDKEKAALLVEQQAFIKDLKDCFILCLDDDREGLITFQNPKIYERFSYVVDDEIDSIIIQPDKEHLYVYKTTLCFNYSKMVDQSPDDDFGDEYECFLLEWNNFGNFESFINDQGENDVGSLYEFNFLGFKRSFSPRDKDFIKNVAVDILEYYYYSISFDHPDGYVRKVRSRERF